MRKALGPVIALLASVSILLTGQGLQTTLLPLRASLEHFPTLAIGTMGAVYFLGFTIGCLKGGMLIKRVGHIRVFLAMAALASAAPLLHGLIVHPFAWTMLRLISGYCFAVLYVVIESWLNEHSTNENRGAIFATYVVITLTVMAAGQMMNLLYDPMGLQLFLIASVLVSIAALPIALSTSPAPAVPVSVAIDLRRLYRVSPIGSIACFGSGSRHRLVLGTGPGVHGWNCARRGAGRRLHGGSSNRRQPSRTGPWACSRTASAGAACSA